MFSKDELSQLSVPGGGYEANTAHLQRMVLRVPGLLHCLPRGEGHGALPLKTRRRPSAQSKPFPLLAVK